MTADPRTRLERNIVASIIVRVDEEAGLLLDVRVDRSTLGRNKGPSVATTLMIDTGTQHTTLQSNIVERLGLTPIGSAKLMGVQGEVISARMYLVDIVIPMNPPRAPVLIANLMVCSDLWSKDNCQLPGKPGGLLGRDVLSKALLSYSGPDNLCVIAFGAPAA